MDNAFVSDGAAEAAVWCLDALVWADGLRPEWRTTLARLLCGVPMTAGSDPIELEAMPELHGEVLAELAASVPMFRRLTSEDIRSLFLQRFGLLRDGEDGPRLEVERDASDVLLCDLPWPLTSVALPWMNRPLPVDWI